MNGVPLTTIAHADAAPAVVLQGGVSLQRQLMDYNQTQLTSYHRLTGYELSTTQNLTSTYFSQAATAIGTGDFGTAASRVAAVAAINVGTGLQVGARTADLVPMMLGGDLDIAGGGASLVTQPLGRTTY